MAIAPSSRSRWDRPAPATRPRRSSPRKSPQRRRRLRGCAGPSRRCWTSPETRAGAGSPRDRGKIPSSRRRWRGHGCGASRGTTSAPGRVVACAKHWVAYGAAEGGREYNAAEVSERTLRTIYFPPFRAALDAGVGTFMTSLNTVDGIPAAANPFTIGRVLRGEWRFDGLVVSDYNAVKQLVAHGMARDECDAARLALTAGIDMEEHSELFNEYGARLVGDGTVPRSRVDEAVRRVLRLKCRLGLLDHPYADEANERAALLSPAHLAAARRVAGRSLVLLKNDDGVLPLRDDLKWASRRRPEIPARPLERRRQDRGRRDPARRRQGPVRRAPRRNAGRLRQGLRSRGRFGRRDRRDRAGRASRTWQSSPWASRRR